LWQIPGNSHKTFHDFFADKPGRWRPDFAMAPSGAAGGTRARNLLIRSLVSKTQ
jgi:hypothetical protein